MHGFTQLSRNYILENTSLEKVNVPSLCPTCHAAPDLQYQIFTQTNDALLLWVPEVNFIKNFAVRERSKPLQPLIPLSLHYTTSLISAPFDSLMFVGCGGATICSTKSIQRQAKLLARPFCNLEHLKNTKENRV